jgi:hypothetical protein
MDLVNTIRSNNRFERKRLIQQKYRLENKEKEKLRKSLWHKKNRERNLKRMKDYKKKNYEIYIQKSRIYNKLKIKNLKEHRLRILSTREKNIARCKKNYLLNKEKRLEYGKNKYKENKEKIKSYVLWYQKVDRRLKKIKFTMIKDNQEMVILGPQLCEKILEGYRIKSYDYYELIKCYGSKEQRLPLIKLELKELKEQNLLKEMSSQTPTDNPTVPTQTPTDKQTDQTDNPNKPNNELFKA